MKTLNPRIGEWQGRRVWIIGAGSGIGAALVTRLREQGAQLALSGRRVSALDSLAHSQDQVLPLDVRDSAALEQAVNHLQQVWGGLDMVIYCAGVYTPMRSWEQNLDEVEKTIAINLQGVYNLLQPLLPLYRRQQAGGLCLVASVAGYTGLPKALAYGPTKAAMINLAQILYADLSSQGIGIYLVNPGFVKSRLTQQNDFHMPAMISSLEAAGYILSGIARGAFEIHFPKRFTLVMKFLSQLPHRLRFYLLHKAVN